MTDQIVIDFPDMPYELEKHFLEHRDEIKVSLWEDNERITIPIKWAGSRICCPVTIYYDLPESVDLTIKSDSKRIGDPQTCEQFGHQDQCPQPEPVECEGFSFCEMTTTQNKHKKR